LLKLGLRKENIGTIERVWGSFGWSEPEELKDILPRVIHMHGKFFSMKDGVEPNVRFEEVTKVLVESGYGGWWSSEFEGPDGVGHFRTGASAASHDQTLRCKVRGQLSVQLKPNRNERVKSGSSFSGAHLV
jgi:hypothetical protein